MKLLAIALVAAAGCGNNNTTTDMAVPADASVPVDLAVGPSAARGEYLVKALMVCGDCHTTPDPTGFPSMDPTKFLAGGREFDIPGIGPNGGVAKVFVKNITPDQASGIGKWTLAQIKTAITKGIDDEGKPLFPIMPYWQFANLTDADATSVAMYLQSVPPQSNVVPEDNVTVPGPAAAVDDTKVPHTTLPMNDTNWASAERGRYLTEVVCLECHTRHNPPGPGPVLDLSKAYGGGEVFPLAPGFTTISANVTPDVTGLKTWTVTDIVQTLKTDQEKGVGRQLCPPMPGGPGRFGLLHDADLMDVANFIHTLPAIANGPFGCTDGGVPYGLPDGSP